ncbi:MAG TPA: hypothetical protein VF456_17000 [Vicinamibacterales bacterium]
MPSTALNRSVVALLTNKSGGNLNFGDVVILDNTNDYGFTTTTTGALSTRGIGVILEPNGIANNATGLVVTCGYCPKINLNTAATRGQFLKTHTVAGQATPHSSPQVEGDFGYALTASATPEAILLGGPNGPGGGSGTVTTTGSPASGQRSVFSGATSITGVNAASRPQGRVTLTTGVPYLVATVTAAGTIYYTPAEGNIVPIYDGTNWLDTAFTELSQATTDATKSPAACANNSNYDLFVWNDGGTLRCTRGPAWSSDTARGTGAGTTELEFVNGILMNKNAITNGPGADRGTYVGTIRTNGTATVDVIFGGTGAAGGESTIVGIWNMYNRRLASLINFDNTDTWTYTTDTFRVRNNNNNNKIQFVIGWQGDGIDATNLAYASNTTVQVYFVAGVGVNSTTAAATGSATGSARSIGSGQLMSLVGKYAGMAPLGFGYVAPLERAQASGTCTFYGDNGGTEFMSSFFLTTMF